MTEAKPPSPGGHAAGRSAATGTSCSPSVVASRLGSPVAASNTVSARNDPASAEPSTNRASGRLSRHRVTSAESSGATPAKGGGCSCRIAAMRRAATGRRRTRAREQLVEDDAGGVDIRLGADGVAAQLLGAM